MITELVIQLQFWYLNILRIYVAFLMENLKINQESIRIFEENTVSKYGDILGTRRLKTLIIGEVCC